MGIYSLKKKTVFLDRDGVINRAIVNDGLPYPPSSINQMEILPEVPQSLNLLKNHGYLLIVVTNQPDVGRGKQRKETVEKMHKYLLENLPLDDFFVCWHAHDNQCNCRKPSSGMLLDANKKYGIDFRNSFIIGDRWKDIEAGKNAGCKTIFIDYQYKERLHSKPDHITTCTKKAAEWIITQ